MDYDEYYYKQLWNDEQAYLDDLDEQNRIEAERERIEWESETYAPDTDIPWIAYKSPVFWNRFAHLVIGLPF